jgi:hypothetical protein
MTSTLTNSDRVELRTAIFTFYENMNEQNLLDIDILDDNLFTLPPFLRLVNSRLTFLPHAYTHNNIHVSSIDLPELMGYVSTTIRLLQIRHMNMRII